MPLRSLMEKLTLSNKSLVLPEGEDPRIWEASKIILAKNMASEIWVLGNSSIVKEMRSRYDLQSASRIKYAPDHLPDLAAKTKEQLMLKALAKGKSLTEDQLHQQSHDPIYQAAWLVASGYCDAGVAGAVASTAQVIRSGLALIGLEEGIKTVSSSFAMHRPGDNPLFWLYTDCGVVIDPTAEQILDIAGSSLLTWKALTSAPPVVAFLSFSTKGSASSESQKKMASATELFKAKYPDILCDGELQFDAAFDENVGTRKAPGSAIPGRANIFVFPNLDAGNIAYKITQRLGGFSAWGPLLQGFSKPWSDLSRGASSDEIVASAMINLGKSL